MLVKRLLNHWTRWVLIVLPLVIVVIVAAVLVTEWRQSDAEKAVRLVRESKSRKENFTVQQYLYATVYYRRDKGEESGERIIIDGWRVEPVAASSDYLVSFTYTDATGQHVALWQANLRDRRIVSKNPEAEELSWH